MCLLFTADIHLRDDCPKCRTDDFLSAQWDKIKQVKALCKKNDALWIDAGDLLHKSRPSLGLLAQAISVLKTDMPIRTVPGNHDQPYHNRNKMTESGLGVLEAAGVIKFLHQDAPWQCLDWTIYSCAYGEEIPVPEGDTNNILVYHGMVFQNKHEMLPGVSGDTAKGILKKAKGYTLVVTGHNHQSFHVRVGDRMLVNVGCLTRQTADFAEYVPNVVLFRDGEIKRLALSCESGVVSRVHLDKAAKKEEELNAFVEGLKDVEQASLSFEANVDLVLNKMNAPKTVKKKVAEAMYE